MRSGGGAVEAATQATEETAEDIIFTLFGPRVWEHEGEQCLLSIDTVTDTQYSDIRRGRLLSMSKRNSSTDLVSGKTWMRQVSTDPASRYDVLYLTERYHHYPCDTRHVLHHVTCPRQAQHGDGGAADHGPGDLQHPAGAVRPAVRGAHQAGDDRLQGLQPPTNIILRYFDSVL